MVAKVLYLSLISPEVVQVCISTSFIQVAALDQNDIVVQWHFDDDFGARAREKRTRKIQADLSP